MCGFSLSSFSVFQFSVKFVNFFKLWTRSKARAAKAVDTEEYCECSESPSTSRLSSFKTPVKFVRSLLGRKTKASTPLGLSTTLRSLSRIYDSEEDSEVSQTLDQLPDSTLIAKDSPLVVRRDRQPPIDQPPRTSVESPPARTDVFPHPPSEWLDSEVERARESP